MMKLFRKLLYTALAFLLTSCGVATGVVSFEILEPAGVVLPADRLYPVIINRAPLDPTIIITPTDEFLNRENLEILDTMIVNHIRAGLLDILQQNILGFGSLPDWIDQRRADTIGVTTPMSAEETRELALKTGSDLILSLESYTIRTSVAVDINIMEYGYYAEICIMPAMVWKIYLPGEVQPYDSYMYTDSLYWGNSGDTPYEALEGRGMPTPTDMVREAAFFGGRDFGKHVSPSWEMADRMVYQGNEKEMLASANLTNSGNWKEAVDIWNELLNSENKALRGKAAFNLAVWYEMNDELETALKYARLAGSMLRSDKIKIYTAQMEKRVRNRQLLIKQLN